jgi:hypothetical protein
MAENVPIAVPQLGRLCPICRNIFDTWDEIVEELEFYSCLEIRIALMGSLITKTSSHGELRSRKAVCSACVFSIA